jgi:formate/nitrite transporter FocA (FNT family)
MGTGFLVVGIAIAIIFALTTMGIILIDYDKREWWKTTVLLFLLGIMALIFVGLGIWLS